MARIAGVDLPGRKHLVIALQYIYGIGPAKAKEICEKTGISPAKKADDLDDGDVKKIREILEWYLHEHPVWFEWLSLHG